MNQLEIIAGRGTVRLKNDMELNRFHKFLKLNVLPCIQNQKKSTAKFKKYSFDFSPLTKYRAIIEYKEDNYDYYMILETLPDHDVVSAIIHNPIREKVLMVQRSLSDDLWPGKWYFLTEHIEGGSPYRKLGLLESTAIRGAQEEVSLAVRVDRLDNPYNIFYQNERFRVWPIVCTAYTDDVKKNNEIKEVEWVPFNKLSSFINVNDLIEKGVSLGDDGHTIDHVLWGSLSHPGVLFSPYAFSGRLRPKLIDLSNDRKNGCIDFYEHKII